MSWEQLCRDYNIPTADEDNKHHREGWTNIQCPFCQDHDLHLGLPEGGFIANCYRCRRHSIEEVISKLLDVPRAKAKHLVRKYHSESNHKKHRELLLKYDEIELPKTIPLTDRHRKYLSNRGFDPDWLEEKYGLRSTPIAGSYADRIVVPIFYRDILVSWQARAVVNNDDIDKYLFPKLDQGPKQANPADILYNFDKAINYNSVMVVEGVTDVWRMGEQAVSTFGMDWSLNQLSILVENWNDITVFFDNSDDATSAADSLVQNLEVFGVNAKFINMDDFDDPADITDDDLVEEIIEIVNRRD